MIFTCIDPRRKDIVTSPVRVRIISVGLTPEIGLLSDLEEEERFRY
jgi:hypothetical protein